MPKDYTTDAGQLTSGKAGVRQQAIERPVCIVEAGLLQCAVNQTRRIDAVLPIGAAHRMPRTDPAAHDTSCGFHLLLGPRHAAASDGENDQKRNNLISL